MRLLSLVQRNGSELPAVLLVLLAVGLIGCYELGCRPDVGGVAGAGAAQVDSLDQSCFFLARTAIDGTPVGSQERRNGRKYVVKELPQASTALCDKDVRSWICQQPPCASWVTTLAQAAGPCPVLCRFLI